MEPDYRYPQPLFSSTGAYFWGFSRIFSPTQEILIAENGRIAPNAPIQEAFGDIRGIADCYNFSSEYPPEFFHNL